MDGMSTDSFLTFLRISPNRKCFNAQWDSIYFSTWTVFYEDIFFLILIPLPLVQGAESLATSQAFWSARQWISPFIRLSSNPQVGVVVVVVQTTPSSVHNLTRCINELHCYGGLRFPLSRFFCSGGSQTECYILDEHFHQCYVKSQRESILIGPLSWSVAGCTWCWYLLCIINYYVKTMK